MTLARGSGTLVGDELVVTAADPHVEGHRDDRDGFPVEGLCRCGVDRQRGAGRRERSLFWRTRSRPDQLNSLPVEVEAGRTVRTVIAGNPAWIGQITGLALAVRGNIVEPMQIRGVLAKPMGLADATRDRFGEWLALEGWSGSSINTMVEALKASGCRCRSCLRVLRCSPWQWWSFTGWRKDKRSCPRSAWFFS